MSEQLTNLERAVLEMMLAGDNQELNIPYRQFSKAIASKRKWTGCGFFTDFEIPAAVPRLQRKGRIAITDVSAEFPELKHGAGFVLFIDDGALNVLEGFCYDESWSDSPPHFTLSYLQESPRGSGHLIPSKERDVEFALKDFTRKISKPA